MCTEKSASDWRSDRKFRDISVGNIEQGKVQSPREVKERRQAPKKKGWAHLECEVVKYIDAPVKDEEIRSCHFAF